MNTAGVVTQGKPNTDAQIFISAMDAYASSTTNDTPGIVVSSNPGWNSSVQIKMLSLTSSDAADFEVEFQLSNLLRRLGVFQSNNFAANTSQEAFGTANGPGPSIIEGTSSPSGFGSDSVVPPILGSNLPTLIGSISGPPKKGIQINSVDLLYTITIANLNSLNLTAVTAAFPLGLNQTSEISPNFNASYDFTSDQIANTSGSSKLSRVSIPIGPPNGMITDDGGVPIIILSGNLRAGAVLNLMGILLNCSYNFN
jgi:hypothetical protein